MKQIYHEVIMIVLIFCLIITSIALGYVGEPKISNIIHKIQGNYKATDQCNNLSLEETAYCLRNEVSEFYSYNKTQDIIRLSEEDLRTRGGDCKNWAEYYIDQADALGFNTERPVVITGDDSAHTFAIISDETGYCILDQLSVDCHRLKNEDK